MEKERKSVGVEKVDALNPARWRVGVRMIIELEWGKSGHPINLDQYWID